MLVPAGLARNDEEVRKLMNSIRQRIAAHQLEPDRRTGDWFSGSQLDDTRRILETRGYEVCRKYIGGRMDRNSKPWERRRWSTLLDILDVASRSRLDVTVVSYIIGKLDQILSIQEEENARHVL